MDDLAKHTVDIHDGRLADVAMVLYMLQTVLARHLLSLACMYVQDAGTQHHQIQSQQEETFQSMVGA